MNTVLIASYRIFWVKDTKKLEKDILKYEK